MIIALIIVSLIGAFFLVRSFQLSAQILDLRAYIDDHSIGKKTEDEIIREDFLKFISDSREWAFDYIETVQSAVKEFKKQIEPEVQYFEKFGEVLGTNVPHYMSLEKISKA